MLLLSLAFSGPPPRCHAALPEVCLVAWESISGSRTLTKDARPFKLFCS